MKKDFMEKVEKIEKLFLEGKKDEQIAKELNLKIGRVPQYRSLLGLNRHFSGLDIFAGDTKRTGYSDSSEKHQISFWIPHDVAKQLGLTDSKYEFFGTVLGKQKIQITLKQLDD